MEKIGNSSVEYARTDIQDELQRVCGIVPPGKGTNVQIFSVVKSLQRPFILNVFVLSCQKEHLTPGAAGTAIQAYR